MLTEEEVKKLEEQARLERRFDDANNQRIVNENMRGVRREQAQNDAWNDVYGRARARRLEARADIAMADPGRFSPFERKALIDWRNRNEPNALRQHELNMLQQKGKDEIAVAEQKRFGMKEQGADAAEWGFKGKEVEGEYGLKQHEIDAAAKTNVATIEAGASKYGADRVSEASKSQHGYFDEKGVYHPGSNVAAAKAQAEAAAAEKEQKRALEEQKLRAAEEKEKNRLKLQYDRLEAKDKASVDAAANALAREKGISFEDARNQVMASRESAAQQGGEAKEGATKTLSSGRKVVFTNGKWQYAN